MNNRSEYYAVEYVNNEPRKVHIFHAAKEGDNDYRAMVSLGAFDTRMCKECLRDQNARRYWVLPKFRWEHMVETDRRLLRLRMSPAVINLPKQFHADLWEFYEAVGYNYKSKRFI